MGSRAETIAHLLDALEALPLSARKMFGEYALYVGDKVVALVCDDTIFVKITEEGRTFVGDAYEEGCAYPGAKPSMRIDGDMIEDRVWLSELVRITEAALPPPKPKRKT